MRPVLLDFPHQFESERLLIRCPLPGDGQDVAEAIAESLTSLQPWMPFAQAPPVLEDIEHNVRVAHSKFLTRDDLRLHLYDKSTGRFVGSSGLHRIHWEAKRFEIGYWLRDSATGKGYITEGVNAITAFADRELLANRIEIRCDSRNTRSRAVAQRCGFHQEAELLQDSVSPEGDLRNTVIFAKIRLSDGRMGYPTQTS